MEASCIKAECPQCQSKFRVSQEHAGRPAKCPKCGTKFRLPESPLPSPPPVKVPPKKAASEPVQVAPAPIAPVPIAPAPVAPVQVEPLQVPQPVSSSYACPNCQGPMLFEPELEGEEVLCPHCDYRFTMQETPDGGGATDSAQGVGGWCVEGDGHTQGPMSKQELDALVVAGQVAADHYVWQVGDAEVQWAADVYPVLSPQTSPNQFAVVTEPTGVPSGYADTYSTSRQPRHDAKSNFVQIVILSGVGGLFGGGLMGFISSQFFPVFGGIWNGAAQPFSPVRMSQIPVHVFAFGLLGAVVATGVALLVTLNRGK